MPGSFALTLAMTGGTSSCARATAGAAATSATVNIDVVSQSISRISGAHRAFHQLLEPRILPQRIERRIHLEPAGRQIERDLEQWLEPVERLVLLARENVGPHQLQL